MENPTKGRKYNFEELPESTVTIKLTAIKNIVKMDPDLLTFSNDSLSVISKATQLFIIYLATEAYNNMVAAKHTRVHYKDCAEAVWNRDSLEFLIDLIPKTIPMKDAQELQRKMLMKDIEELN